MHVPDASTVYTGDILFIGGTPIVWAGPLSNWVAACDLMLASTSTRSCPGTARSPTSRGVARGARLPGARRSRGDVVLRGRPRRVRRGAAIGAAIGADERFSELGEFGRIAVNVETVYRTLDPTHQTPDVVEQFRRMAELEHS